MSGGEKRPGYVTANLSSYRITKAYRDDLKKALQERRNFPPQEEPKVPSFGG